jgi:hypothetical protein
LSKDLSGSLRFVQALLDYKSLERKPRFSTAKPAFPVKENSYFVFLYPLPENRVFSLEMRKNFSKKPVGLLQVVSNFA